MRVAALQDAAVVGSAVAPRPRARDMTAIHQRNADQIFNAAVSMRGMLVKMCQVVGTRSDIFPPQYVKTLSQCHDRLPPRDFEAIKQVVEEDFGRPLGEVFSEFSPTAIAAASLAQVHKARLVERTRGGGEGAIPRHRSHHPHRPHRIASRCGDLPALRLESDGLPAAARRAAAAPEDGTRFPSRGAKRRTGARVLRRRSDGAHPGDSARALHAPRHHDGVCRRREGERPRGARARRHRILGPDDAAHADLQPDDPGARFFPRRSASRQHPGEPQPARQSVVHAARLRPCEGTARTGSASASSS